MMYDEDDRQVWPELRSEILARLQAQGWRIENADQAIVDVYVEERRNCLEMVLDEDDELDAIGPDAGEILEVAEDWDDDSTFYDDEDDDEDDEADLQILTFPVARGEKMLTGVIGSIGAAALSFALFLMLGVSMGFAITLAAVVLVFCLFIAYLVASLNPQTIMSQSLDGSVGMPQLSNSAAPDLSAFQAKVQAAREAKLRNNRS